MAETVLAVLNGLSGKIFELFLESLCLSLRARVSNGLGKEVCRPAGGCIALILGFLED